MSRNTSATPKSSAETTDEPTGETTKSRIVAAALECLGDEGIVGVSARAIARRGGFNQALIFYHFGSVDGLLVAAAVTESRQRSARYADRLGDVTTLQELVAVARHLHDEEFDAGNTAMLVQLMAGAAGSEELRKGVADGLTPWMDLVDAAVTRVTAGTAIPDLVPISDMSFVIASMFIGMDLIMGLDPENDRMTSLFTTMERLGVLVDALMKMLPAGVTLPGVESS